MKNKPLQLCLLLVLIVSCNRTRTTIITEKDLPRIAISCSGALSYLDKTVPQSIDIVGQKLVVLEKYDYPFIKVYNLEQGKKDLEFGSKNNPKWTLNEPILSGHSMAEDKSDKLYVTDAKSNQFLTFDLSDTFNVKPVNSVSIPMNLVLRFSNIYKLESNKYWCTYLGADRRGRFYLYDNVTHKTKWLTYSPQTNKFIAVTDMPYYYYSYTSYNDQQKVLGAAMKFFKRVEFYDSNGRLTQVSVFKPFDSIAPAYTKNIVQNPNQMIYYNESFAGKKYFYTTCVNAKAGNYSNNIGKMEVHVFDWTGTLKKIIELDKMFLGSFAVDERKNKMYIISFIKSDQLAPILTYDLSKTGL